MTPTNAAHSPVPHPVEGVEEWLDLVEQALQGLHHALNNRIGSLSALVELFQLGDLSADTEGADAGVRSLAGDLARLEDCSRLVRLLPRDTVATEEPLILDDVLADVFVIHRFLHDLRDLQVTIVPTRYLEPVRVERWALVRVLTLLLRDAKRLANEVNTVVRALTESDEQWVRVEFRVGLPPVAAIPVPPRSTGGGRYAESLAAALGGNVNRRPGAVELLIPTLKARRAVERQ